MNITARHFIATDGNGDVTVWENRDNQDPIALVRWCDLPSDHRDTVWALILHGVESLP